MTSDGATEGRTALHDALAQYADDYSVRRRLAVDDRHATHAVVVDGRRAVCKTTTVRPAGLAREAAIARAVRARTPVPVPEVLATGTGYLLAARCPGDRYVADAAPSLRRARLRAVGRTLAGLHDATTGWVDGHGDVTTTATPAGRSGSDTGATTGGPSSRADAPPPPTVREGDPWDVVLAERVRAWANRLTDPRDEAVGAAVREHLAARRGAFAGVEPVVVHGEATPDHVRFDGGRVGGVLDWETATAAPGEADLVRAELGWFESPFAGEPDAGLRPALRAGYESVRPLPAGFDARRPVYRAAFTVRFLHHADRAAERAGVDPERLAASMRSFAYDRLDEARAVDGGRR